MRLELTAEEVTIVQEAISARDGGKIHNLPAYRKKCALNNLCIALMSAASHTLADLEWPVDVSMLIVGVADSSEIKVHEVLSRTEVVDDEEVQSST